MDNLKLPASPQHGAFYPSTDTVCFNVDPDFAGFTKIELASLMIAQGMYANPNVEALNTHMITIAEISVRQAMAIIEEANK